MDNIIDLHYDEVSPAVFSNLPKIGAADVTETKAKKCKPQSVDIIKAWLDEQDAYTYVGLYVSGLTYKERAKCKMLRGIYRVIYCELTVSVSGGYVLQYAGGTSASRTCCSEQLKCRKSSTVL